MTTNEGRTVAETSQGTEECSRINHDLTDFLPSHIGENTSQLDGLNDFFNSSVVKSELHWFTHRETLERAASRDDRCLFYFAPKGDIIAGAMVWCQSRVLDDHEAQIRLIAVDPNYRNHGLGRSLVKQSLAFAATYDQTSMIADVDAEAPAVQFWKACGFTKDYEYETDSNRLMYRMRRKIPDD